MTGSSRERGVFPFIVGIGRSGTTLLRAILDSHPDLAIPAESDFIVQMALREERYYSLGQFDRSSFLEDLFRHPRFQRWDISERVVRQAMNGGPIRDFASAIRAVYEAYATHKGKPHYGDKTPSYLYHMNLLGRLFPEGKFVHIVRDGRDVVLSRLDYPSMPGKLPSQALLWRRGLKKGRRLGRHLGHERYIEVRYEDLVKDPDAVIREVCRFLGMQFDPSMLQYHERASEIIASTEHPESHNRINLPPTAGLRDWRSQMSGPDVEVFGALAGDVLVQLGYERGVARRTPRARATAWRLKLGVQSRRVARAIRERLGQALGRAAGKD